MKSGEIPEKYALRGAGIMLYWIRLRRKKEVLYLSLYKET